MDKLSYNDIISLLALVAALGALSWNIFRDLIAEKVSVEFFIAFGETGNIKDSTTSLFADAGSLFPTHKFDNIGMLIEIINTGRKPIVVSKVGGKLRNGNEISIVIAGLPKTLQPYEIFSSITTLKQKILEQIQKDKIEDLWVQDTKNKKWLLSTRGWKRLKKTTEYIASGKNV